MAGNWDTLPELEKHELDAAKNRVWARIESNVDLTETPGRQVWWQQLFRIPGELLVVTALTLAIVLISGPERVEVIPEALTQSTNWQSAAEVTDGQSLAAKLPNAVVNSSDGFKGLVSETKNGYLVMVQSGSATFDLPVKLSKPLVVETGDLKILVVGTAFKVSVTTEGSRVKLIRGSIQILDKTKPGIAIITPSVGQIVSAANTQVAGKQPVQPKADIVATKSPEKKSSNQPKAVKEKPQKPKSVFKPTHLVKLSSGKSFKGIIVSENVSTMVLKIGESKEITIKKEDLEEINNL